MKRPGHCTLCDERVREVVRHRDGEPIQLGSWEDDAWRVTFLLSDKTTGDMTFCEGCLDKIEASKAEIWARVLERFDWEESVRPTTSEETMKFLNHIKGVKIRKEIGRVKWNELNG